MKRISSASAPLCVVAAGVLFIGACSHTPPASYYLLTAPATDLVKPPTTSARLGLGPIRLPKYLDRPQIVSWETGARLKLSNEHRWAEPLADSFSRALLANLARVLPATQVVQFPWKAAEQPARQLSMEVLRFERAVDGSMKLGARWTVANGRADPSPATYTSEISVPISGEANDYDALVTAASAAVTALAEDIAAQLLPK